jgi:diphosphomevalonate decarboxylase
MRKATAVAHPNIAFVKYWGRVDEALNLPANASLSMNLAALSTVTSVEFRPGLDIDEVSIDGLPATGQALDRVVAHLDRVRRLACIDARAVVTSRNDFPAGTGLASSASAFAALSLAATRAAGLVLDEAELSRLARLGSGSASRSVPGGFTLWATGDDESSHARQVAAASHWDLRDVIAIVTSEHKAVGSDQGHRLAATSPLHRARLAAVPRLLGAVQAAIQARDLDALGRAAEADAMAMHAVMMTSQPPLLYWQPATVAVLQAIGEWRAGGVGVYYTLDAGPNIHCLCSAADEAIVASRLQALPGVTRVVASGPGGGARLIDSLL